MKFEIKPHIGTNEISFGMTRNEVHMKLGKPGFSKGKSVFEFNDVVIPEPAKDGYYENELQISYDENECVVFIEFSGKSSEHTNANYDEKDNETPYSCTFKNIDLGLWRSVIPEVDETLIDVPESDDGKYFWTVGIGSIGYYQNA